MYQLNSTAFTATFRTTASKSIFKYHKNIFEIAQKMDMYPDIVKKVENMYDQGKAMMLMDKMIFLYETRKRILIEKIENQKQNG